MKFWLPKFNIYTKKFSMWQDKDFRRLRLLNFAGFNFWNPEDYALLAHYGHGSVDDLYSATLKKKREQLIQNSVGVHAGGFTNAAQQGAGGSSGVGTLTLNTLFASQTDEFIAISTISFTRDGDVEENNVDQNPTVEYTDSTDTTVGDDCQCKMDHTGGGTTPSFSSGWSENTYIAISTERTATMSSSSGTKTSTGTAYVRETTNTSNVVSAGYTLRAIQFGGGILL